MGYFNSKIKVEAQSNLQIEIKVIPPTLYSSRQGSIIISFQKSKNVDTLEDISIKIEDIQIQNGSNDLLKNCINFSQTTKSS